MVELQRPEDPQDSVSVIIPTTLRPTLERAVASVRAQRYPGGRIELVLVADVPPDVLAEAPPARLADADVVVCTGGVRNGGFARQLGVERSTGRWVAFLDDDDEWVPDKLERQVAAARRSGGTHVAVSCQRREVARTGVTSRPVPTVPFDGARPVEDYLFRSRGPTAGRASLPTSTLLVSRAGAAAVPWRADLRRHQDWDWLVRFSRLPGARLTQLEQPLVLAHMGSAGSISASTDWQSSLSWLHEWVGVWEPRVVADFATAQCLRYALSARSLRGVVASVRLLLRVRRAPSARSVLLGLTGVLNRRQAQRMFFVVDSVGRGHRTVAHARAR